jgi:disulfide bond formation protein DsbB
MRALARLTGSPRRVALVLALGCVGLVGGSLFVQHVLDVEPCPLCIVQRFTYLALIPVFLAAALVKPYGKTQRSLLWGATLLTLMGLAVAGYQTKLQLFPPPVTASCSAGLAYMLDTMAVTEVIARLVHAGGDCADTSFKVLGLTLAQASLIIFAVFSGVLGYLLRPRSRPSSER